MPSSFNIRLDRPLSACADRDDIIRRLNADGCRIMFAGKYIPWITVETNATPSRVNSAASVKYIELDGECSMCVSVQPSIHEIMRDRAWPSEMIGVRLAHRLTRGKGAVIAVLDTGVSHHQELYGARLSISRSMVQGEAAVDLHGHGTATTGIVAAQGVVLTGVCPDATVISIKVLNKAGSGPWSRIAAGIERAIDSNVDVVLMALGGDTGSAIVSDALVALAVTGAVAVVAAGNDGAYELDFPGVSPFAITVAAVDRDGRVPEWSASAPWPEGPDIAAPGVDVPIITRDGGYGLMSGTSMASAVAAGCLALMFSTDRRLRLLTSAEPCDESVVVEVRRRLRDSSEALGVNKARVGYGLINADGLVKAR